MLSGCLAVHRYAPAAATSGPGPSLSRYGGEGCVRACTYRDASESSINMGLRVNLRRGEGGGGDLRARRRIGILLLRHGRMRCLSGVLCSPRRSCLAGASGSCRYRSALRGFLRSRRSAARRGFRGFHFRRTATLLQRIYVSSNDSLCWRCRALAGKGGE